MELNTDLADTSGMRLLARGQQLSEFSIASLRNYLKRGSIGKSISVRTKLIAAKAA